MKRLSDNEKNNFIKINEEEIRDHLGPLVKNSVEETLNIMLEAEAYALCKVQRCKKEAV